MQAAADRGHFGARWTGLGGFLPAIQVAVVVALASGMLLWAGWWARAQRDAAPRPAVLHELVPGGPVLDLPATVSWTPAPDDGEGSGVRAHLLVPDRGLDIRMTIRKNEDATLPASHIVEVVTGVAPGSAIGRVRSVPSLMVPMIGPPRALAGLTSEIAEGAFWIALSALPREADANLRLLRFTHLLALPLVYANGQRAAIEFPKGPASEPFFRQALVEQATASGKAKP